MSGVLDPRVQRIREAVRNATGSDSPKLASTVRFLERHGRSLHEGDDDLVVYEVYRDEMLSGRIRTFGDIVIPGRKTSAAFPATEEFGIHFLKVYTAESPPIGRGETPAVEFARTLRALAKMPADIGARIKPLGHDEFSYRSRVVPGQTFAATSPFSDLSYEKAVAEPLAPEAATELAMRIGASYDTIIRLHSTGVLHGDLHLDNIMWIADEAGPPAQPIDLAAACLREEASAEAWTAGVFDDLNEFLREAGLLQLNQRKILPGTCFNEARRLAQELFPDDIAGQLTGLKS